MLAIAKQHLLSLTGFMAYADPMCSECGSSNTRVVTTRPSSQDFEVRIVRWRCCKACGHRFYTVQPQEEEIDKWLVKWGQRGSCSIEIIKDRRGDV